MNTPPSSGEAELPQTETHAQEGPKEIRLLQDSSVQRQEGILFLGEDSPQTKIPQIWELKPGFEIRTP